MIVSARGVPDLTTLLAATAVEPTLDAVLLLDLPADALETVADVFAGLLGLRTGTPVPPLVLGGHLTDDDLWTTIGLRDTDSGPVFTPAPGPLVGSATTPAPLLVVPDLARAGLPVVRAAVETAGAPVATVQRHGITRVWRPRGRWLAACAAVEAGRVSPHVLDRFVVRFPAERAFPATDQLDRLAGAVTAGAAPAADPRKAAVARGRPLSGAVPPAWRHALTNDHPVPIVEESAIEAALRLHPDGGVRRPLSLVRLARGLARLDGAAAVTDEHVGFAATLTALVDPTRTDSPVAAEEIPARMEDTASDPVSLSAASHSHPARSPGAGPATPRPAPDPGPAQSMGAEPAAAGGRPYPEDVVEADREATPLRLPWQRRRGRVTAAGSVIGTRPATDLTDIAWVATVIAAGRFQPLRRRRSARPRGGRIELRATDLRSYRRAPEPEHLLGLLLDHTCRSGWDWLPALSPFLRWAYVRRAAVCLVQVGAASAASELRAEQARLRSVLDPRLSTALMSRPGLATPLAHGLELAHAMLRHHLQHGRAPVTDAVLLVVTDALGNVPLRASLQDRVATPVTDEGVRDAVEAAGALRRLDNLRVVCVQPPGRPYPHLLGRLAQALDATVVPARQSRAVS